MIHQKLAVCLFFIIVFVQVSSAEQPPLLSQDASWNEFKLKTSKSYPNPQVEQYRKNCFQRERERVRRNNADPNKRFEMVLNEFSDMTPDQFKLTHLTTRPQPPTLREKEQSERLNPMPKNVAASGSVDWKKAKKVTNVRNQGACGSCWAFASSAAMQSAYLIAEMHQSRKKIHVSEQQQVSCIYESGCNGGWMGRSFQFAMDGGITTDKEFPYTASNGGCSSRTGKYTLTGYFYQQTSCDDVRNLLAQQPLTVTVDAGSWQNVGKKPFPYQRTDWGDLNHAVLLTGFKQKKKLSKSFWIIKNSWGTNWGHKGYMKLRYGDDGNNCGICLATPYPIV